MCGLRNGCLFWCKDDMPLLFKADSPTADSSWLMISIPTSPVFRRPMLGVLPWCEYDSASSFNIGIPIWLPLSMVLGWIVIRELRWREKRAKATQDTP
jgi:hypothetical protein